MGLKKDKLGDDFTKFLESLGIKVITTKTKRNENTN